MDIEKVVRSAVAIATVDFHKRIEADRIRLANEKDLRGLWALPEALLNQIPCLIEQTLIHVISEMNTFPTSSE